MPGSNFTVVPQHHPIWMTFSKNGLLSINQDQQQATLPFPMGMALKYAILHPALSKVLPMINFQPSFSMWHGALSLPHLYDSQGFHLSALLKFGLLACTTGQLHQQSYKTLHSNWAIVYTYMALHIWSGMGNCYWPTLSTAELQTTLFPMEVFWK